MDGDKNIIVSGGGDDRELISPELPPTSPADPDGSVTWRASEFVSHQKSPLWYVAIIVLAVAFAAIIWFATKDYQTSGIIVLVGVVLAIFGSKKPRNLEYRLDSQGLQIGPKHYPFARFRSFTVTHRGDYSSLDFLPMKRFNTILSVAYDAQDEKKIIDIISSYIPLEEKKSDLIDSLMWRIRF